MWEVFASFPQYLYRSQAMLLGIVIGHLYFFLTMKYPQEFGGRTLISTPQFLYECSVCVCERERGGTVIMCRSLFPFPTPQVQLFPQ